MKAAIMFACAAALAPFAATARDIQYDLRVDGLTCPFCVATSERALMKIEGVRRVSSTLSEGLLHVCADEAVVFTDQALSELFLSKGFTFRSKTVTEGCDDAEAD